MRFFVLLVIFCLSNLPVIGQYNAHPSDFVNTSIGTGGHGHTFPGAVVPFGMVQLSPDTRNDASWDGCGGYYYHDSFIYGFSHTHLSGTGVSDFGDILFKPLTAPIFEPTDYRSKFSHDSEIFEAGHYGVWLDNKIRVELTSTSYSGFQQYHFTNQKERWILIDLEHRDPLLSHHLDAIEISGGVKIRGHRQSKQWANNQWVFFESIINSPVEQIKFNRSKTKVLLKVSNVQVTVKTTLSFTSMDGVEVNSRETSSQLSNTMQREFAPLPEMIENEFQSALIYSKRLWDAELGRIQVDNPIKINKGDLSNQDFGDLWISLNQNETIEKKEVFYTALYHCMIHPSLASDANGKYRGRDQIIHTANHRYYHVFSLWDTYRALHPLLSLINKQRTKEFILTMLLQHEQGGRLPVWELGSCETDCMIGFHSVPVIADAVFQDVEFDSSERVRIMRAIRHSSDYKEESYTFKKSIPTELLTLYGLKLGYIDVINQSESVSKQLEYAFDDYCAWRIARFWDFRKDKQIFRRRSERWRGLFDDQTHSFRPRKNGQWLSDFKLNEVNNHYTEANAWQYRFAVPQAIPSLIQSFGGKSRFERSLDSLFSSNSQTSGREQADITGLIGQYAHGNEPSHHMAYLYNAVNKPWKSQNIIQKIQDEFYTSKPDGYIGNEDCGQMSAWHVLSTLGFYPVAPGSGEWYLGTPGFDSMIIYMEDAKHIVITRDQRPKNEPGFYVSSEDISKQVYTERYRTFPTYYYDLLPKQNVMSNTFMMIHRRIHFEWTPIPDLQSEDESNNKTDSKPLSTVPVISAPHRVAKGEAYTLKIHGSGGKPLWVFVRLMDSTLNFPKAKNDFWSRSHYSPKVNSAGIPIERVPGYGAHHRFFYVWGSDTSIVLKGTALVWASYAFGYDDYDFTASYVHEKPNNYRILSIDGDYNPQYSGGGMDALVDGELGTTEWRSGSWQGYQGQDVEVLIDFSELLELRMVQLRFLRDERAWIFYPSGVEVKYSSAGENFYALGDNANNLQRFRGEEAAIFPLSLSSKKPVKARFLKVKAKTFGPLPEGHPGHPLGGEAFIFWDEILVNPPIYELIEAR